ncbi:MAG: hypothetical protein ACTSPB_18255 [Candidatus Thorarchaeota archaeon]
MEDENKNDVVVELVKKSILENEEAMKEMTEDMVDMLFNDVVRAIKETAESYSKTIAQRVARDVIDELSTRVVEELSKEEEEVNRQ